MDLQQLRKTVNRFLRSLPRRRWFRFFTLWLAPFLLLESFFFAALTKESNLLEFYPGELILPSLMHACTALLIATLAYRIKRPQSMGGKLVVVAVMGLLLVDYDNRLQPLASIIRSLLPPFLAEGESLLTASLCFLAILTVLAIFLGRRTEHAQKKYESLSSFNLVVSFFIFAGFLAAGNTLRVLTALPDLIKQAHVAPQHFTAPEPGKTPADKPDIYYLVVDRYANQDVFREEFDYDNSSFVGFLRQNGFVVQDNAQANYPYTDMSIASTINADYLSKYASPHASSPTQSHALYHSLIQRSSVIEALKNAGYSYHHIGTWYNATSRSPLADVRYVTERQLTLFGRSKVLTSIEGQEISKSPYYQLLKAGLPGLGGLHETKGVALPEEQLSSLRDIAAAPQQGGRFIFAHILTVHQPYYFNADGSYTEYTTPDNSGQHVRTKYINQVKFTNTQLQDIIASIQKNSGGKAVILLTSDEGPYPDEMNPGSAKVDNMTEWSDEWLRMKYGILQAVHIPKATSQDLDQVSGVNMFRIVMNRYLGSQLDYLPQCNLAPKGRDFQFTHIDLTRRLNGEADPYCNTVTSR